MNEWILHLVESAPYAGVAALMLVENLIPLVPSELVMPVAGFVAANKHAWLTGVIAAGTLGSVLGTLPYYWLGLLLGRGGSRRWLERHGRWLTLSSNDLDRVQRLFERHGPLIVLFGRILPAVGTLVSIPAGCMRMRLPVFLLCTAAGSLFWTVPLALAGLMLGDEHRLVERVLSPLCLAFFALLFVVYAWRVIFYRTGGTSPATASCSDDMADEADPATTTFSLERRGCAPSRSSRLTRGHVRPAP